MGRLRLVAIVSAIVLIAAVAKGGLGAVDPFGGDSGPYRNLHAKSCTKDDHNSDRSQLVAEAMRLGKQLSDAKFGTGQWVSLDELWKHESEWYPRACNVGSGACGIPQALPCEKMTDRTIRGQIRWGLDYIEGRYGTPDAAWGFWRCIGQCQDKKGKQHKNTNWY